MKKYVMRGLAFAIALGASQAAVAQDSNQRVAVNSDWNVFVDDNPKTCWIISAPVETVNTRDGNVVAVNRGSILLYVTYAPSQGANGQVSFTGGYPFADGSNVTLDVDGSSWDLWVDGEHAWTRGDDQDSAIIAAMRRGAKATLTGRSGRGTMTKDTFSLRGFTASVEDAATRCK